MVGGRSRSWTEGIKTAPDLALLDAEAGLRTPSTMLALQRRQDGFDDL
jgi:hypothetical protein